MKRLQLLRCGLAGIALLAVPLVTTPAPAATWETCVEAIAKTQHELKLTQPPPAEPKTHDQTVAAQDSHEPTPSSLEAAGLTQPQSGAAGALNEALNLQAAGNEAGCLNAVAKARSLAGLK